MLNFKFDYKYSPKTLTAKYYRGLKFYGLEEEALDYTIFNYEFLKKEKYSYMEQVKNASPYYFNTITEKEGIASPFPFFLKSLADSCEIFYIKLKSKRVLLYIPLWIDLNAHFIFNKAEDPYGDASLFPDIAYKRTSRLNSADIVTVFEEIFKEIKNDDFKYITIYYTFPLFGAVAEKTFDLEKSTEDEIKKRVSNDIEGVLSFLDKPSKYKFFSGSTFLNYFSIFEKDNRTPLLAYTTVGRQQIVFEKCDNILEHFYSKLLLYNSFSEFLKQSAVIVQEIAHGPWQIWYNSEEKRSIEAADNMYYLCLNKFKDTVKFNKFLKGIYHTDIVLPYDLDGALEYTSIARILPSNETH